MKKPTRLSSLGWRVLGKIERDPHYPHWLILHDVFGRPLLQIQVTDVYDGKGQRFEDDVPR